MGYSLYGLFDGLTQGMAVDDPGLVNQQAKYINELISKLRLLKHIRLRPLDFIKIVLALIKYYAIKRNFPLDVAINLEGIWFKAIDIESLFILSPRFEDWMWKYLR